MMDMVFYCATCNKETDYCTCELAKLRTELAAAQADNARLRDALEKIRTAHLLNARTLSTAEVHAICFEALSDPSEEWLQDLRDGKGRT